MFDLLWVATAAVTVATLYLFGLALHWPRRILVVVSVWCALQAMVALTGFYQLTDGIPPRFLLLPVPPLLLIAAAFLTPRGRAAIDEADLRWLTYLHTIRLPVELALWQLAERGLVPHLMTFEGRNFDALTGVTAPLVAYFGLARGLFGRRWLIAWNLAGLLLLANILFYAILSLPTPFQLFAFDQPNIAVLSFPYVWIPCCIVPIVLFAHLAALRQLFRSR